jgi:hypothetical protein
MRGGTKRLRFNLKEETPKDFLLGLGVLVAVNNPVRTAVVVVTVALAPVAVGVDVEAMELQSEDALYRTPLIMTPWLLIIMFLCWLLQVSGMFLSQHVAEGDSGRLFV